MHLTQIIARIVLNPKVIKKMENEFTISNEARFTIHDLKTRKIDFDKVNTLEDVINILEAMNITIMGEGEEYKALKDYLKDA